MSSSNKRRFRIASIVFAVFALAIGLFYVLNTSAEPSQASDDTDQEATAEETKERRGRSEGREEGRRRRRWRGRGEG